MACPECGGTEFSASVGNRYKLSKDDTGKWSASFSDCYEVIISCDDCLEHISLEDTDEIDLDFLLSNRV